jgi:glycosyltransferase involved in cell wall biosynthesis
MSKLSVVICVYNEAENIEPLISSLEKSLKGHDHEIIFVDDGSLDNTSKIIKANSNELIRLVTLTKNYGQSSALSAGISCAEGDFIATMDGDLQNDPVDIPVMLEMLENGDYDMVVGYREDRKDNFFLRKLPSLIANFIINRSTRTTIKDYGCTLKIFRKEIAKSLKLYGELHRFIPMLASLEGYTRIGQISVRHHPRIHGKSKYGLDRTVKVISDLMLMMFIKKYMQKPMHFFGLIGIPLTLAGIVINLYMLALKISGADIWGKPLMILGVMLFLAGLQFLTTGIFSELLIRTYFESQNKKPYNIKSVLRFEKSGKNLIEDSIKTVS